MNYHDNAFSPMPPRRESGPVADRVCQVLCDILRTGIDIHRCQAAQALGNIGNAAAVDDLVAALLDEDEDVRTDAAEALCRVGDPDAAPQLMENLLGDPCPEVKLAAMRALAQMDYREVVPWLRRLVRGRDEEIVWDEEAFYEGGWDDWVDIQVLAIRSLVRLGVGEAVPDIVDAIEDEDGQDITEIGFNALAGMGDSGVAALVQFLAHTDTRRRRRAAAVLSRIDGDAAASALRRAFEDAAAEVRLAAAQGVATRNPADLRLATLLGDPDAGVRAALVRVAGRHFPDQVLDLFDDRSDIVKLAVLELLAKVPDLLPSEAVLEWARTRLTDADANVAAAAARVLAVVAKHAAKGELMALLADTSRPCEVRLGALSGLARLGDDDDVVQAFVDVLGDDERQIRLDALAALATRTAAEREWPNRSGTVLLAALRGELLPEPELGPDTAVPAEASQDEVPAGADDIVADRDDEQEQGSFPTSTIEAILGNDGATGDDIGIPEKGIELRPEDIAYLALAQARPRKRRMSPVEDIPPHQDVPRFTARILGDVPRAEVAEALAPFAAGGDRDTGVSALDSLFRIGAAMGALPDAVVDRLMATISDADRDVRRLAVRALGWSASEKPLMALIGCLADSDSFVRTEAIRALVNVGEMGPNVARLLDDPDPAVRLAAAEAVAAAGGREAVDRLVDFALAFEGYHRREVGRLLRGVDPESASIRLLEVLDDRDRLRLWQPAIEALEELNRPDTPSDNTVVV